MPINKKKGESKKDYISRCIGEEITKGHEKSQAAAICYSKYKETMKDEKIENACKKLKFKEL